MGAAIRFDGQGAVVTGAGAGLGREYAVQLASRGAAVVCNDVVRAAAESTAASIAELGGTAVPEWSSVATPEGGAAIVAVAVEEFGSVDVLVSNAGQLRNAAFADMAVEDFDDVVRTHLGGAFHVAQPAFRRMAAAGHGRIVLTASSALFGSPWQANYSAAKAGIVGLCRSVALEGADRGVHANVVLPMALTGIGRDGPPYPRELMAATVDALSPLAPDMTVENVAPLVLFLASRECGLNGRAFAVGCGHVAEGLFGVVEGWYGADRRIGSPEDIAAAVEVICDPSGFEVPASMLDQVRLIERNRPGS